MKKKIAILFTAASALIFLPFVTPLITAASSDGIDTDISPQADSDEDAEEDSGYGIDDSGFFMPIPVDWQVMDAEITTAMQTPQSHNVNILTGNAFEIPVDTLRHISGQNVTLALQTGNEFAFSVSGSDVRTAGTPLRISLTAPAIPEDVKQSVTVGAAVIRVFCMAERSPYPFRVNVHMDLGAENAGKLAMLYYYDEGSNSMRIAGSFRITASGQAMFGINRGDEYIVVVADRVVGYTVAYGDTLSHIAHRSGISLAALKAANPHIADYNRIREGQVINLPLR